MTRWILLTPLIASLAADPALPQAPKDLPTKAPADKPDGPPVVSAKGWVIADGATGRVLWGANETEPLVLASTTKIMTAYIVLRLAADEPKVLDEVVTVSEKAAKTTGTGAKLKAGEKLAVRDLLYGLLLPSGNDAAVVIAEHFGPRFKGDGEAAFIAEMNRRAAALKMEQTKYFDPHGLGKNHASPRDLARLAAEAMKDPAFRTYVGTRRHEGTVTGPDGREMRTAVWDNTNRLLGIEGYDGIKTGTTNAAGSCLVGSGRRGGDHLIVVVLGATSNDSRYVDTRNLFRWAWSQRANAK
jgi:D-alanyl-D-alanine carboxypeptidase (penicillin-binding protein 5/6)